MDIVFIQTKGDYNPTRTLYYLTGIQEFFQDNPASVAFN